MNLYGFVGNNPANNLDPHGLLFGGRINAGECSGHSAAQFWADKYVSTGNVLYAVPGAFASLWTPQTSDYTFATLAIGYAAGKLPSVAKNFKAWAKSPFWYEMGQKTVPTSVYNAVKHLPAVARGKAIVAEMGWIGALLPSAGPWGTTLAAGPTPGGLLATMGLGLGSLISGGSDCECE